jgi:hypothetical protein
MSANAEAANKMAESNARAHEVMKKSAELRTGHKDTEAQKTIHDIGKEITKQKQEIMEIQKAGNVISFHLNPWGEKRDIAEHTANIARLTGEYQALKSAAGGFQERHLGTAVHGQQLGVLRLEHTMQSRDNPLLAEAQKQTALLQQIAGHNAGGSSQGEAPGRLGGLMNWRWLFKSRGFTPQAGL